MARITVGRTDIAAVEVLHEPPAALSDHQIRLAVDVFGMSANNISYAMTGEFLGYWAHFPVDEARGCVPVWGFADVVESRQPDIEVGERIFGYLPMATELVVQPDAVTDLVFSDSIEHRSTLHRGIGGSTAVPPIRPTLPMPRAFRHRVGTVHDWLGDRR